MSQVNPETSDSSASACPSQAMVVSSDGGACRTPLIQSVETKPQFPLTLPPVSRLPHRPIYPKPPKERTRAIDAEYPITQPIALVVSVPGNQTPDYICFSVYDQTYPPALKAMSELRASYANTIVSQQRLRAFASKVLFLDEIIPKSKVSKVDKNPPAAPLFFENFTSWRCSHTLPKSDTVNGPSADVKPGDLTRDAASTDFSDRLRPSARLLVRLGRQLVRSQYEHMAVNECACSLRSSPKVISAPFSSDSAADSTMPMRSESQHLEWQPKPPHQRWNRVRELCQKQNCHFIPSTMFQFHRHLETGHHKFTTCLPVDDNLSITSVVNSVEGAVESQNKRRIQASVTSKLMTPVVVDMTRRGTSFFCCPVCSYVTITSVSLLSHVNRNHPFITPRPLEQPTSSCCNICGRSSPSGLMRSTNQGANSGVIFHDRCNPLQGPYLHASWSAHDAHPLACLILYPNNHSRITVPMLAASQLYHAMDFVLSTNVSRLKLWSMSSHTLRCSLAISALYGRLKDSSPAQVRVNNSRNITRESANVSAVQPLLLPAPSAALPTLALTSSATMTTDQLTSSISARTILPVATESPLMQAILERPLGSKRSASVSFVPSEVPPRKKPCDPNSTEPAAMLNGCGSSPHPEPDSNPPPPNLTIDLTNDQGATSATSTPAKGITSVQTLKETKCELCAVRVATTEHRQHLLDEHNCLLDIAPSEYCSFCGQLFWTSQGCTLHQQVRCEVCSSNGVCKSTIYIHMALKHSGDLADQLRTQPAQCLLCSEKTDQLPAHLESEHFCTIPTEVLNHVSVASIPNLRSNVTHLASLRELAPLYLVSMSTIRSQVRSCLPFPEHVAFMDPLNTNLSIFRCSTCYQHYISAAQLDLHLVQSGHHCWCSTCLCPRRRMRELSGHTASKCLSQKRNGLKFIRLDAPQNSRPVPTVAITTASPAVAISVPPPTPELPVIRKAYGSLTQFHGCDHCRVFCLTLEDLDAHRQSVHNCAPLPGLSTAASTVVVTVPSSAPLPNNFHCATSLTQTVFASGTPLVKSTPMTTAALSYQPVVRPTVSIMPSVLPVQPVLIVPGPAVPQPITPLHPTSEVLPTKARSEELVCPMCEFQSTNRADIMQHITDTH